MKKHKPRVRIVTANAGVGKTHTLMDIIGTHVEKHGFSFLCLAFNVKKAESLAIKIGQRFSEERLSTERPAYGVIGHRNWAMTIHALANHINKANNDITSVPADFEIDSHENDPEKQDANSIEAQKYKRMLLEFLRYPVCIDKRPSPIGEVTLLVVDEIQDLCYTHVACIAKLVNELRITEVVLAGDINQSIYADKFREKDSELLFHSFDVLRKHLPEVISQSPFDYFASYWPQRERLNLPNVPNRFEDNPAIPQLVDSWLSDAPTYRPYSKGKVHSNEGNPAHVILTTDFEETITRLKKQLEKIEKQTKKQYLLSKEAQKIQPSPLVILVYTNWERERIAAALSSYGDATSEDYDLDLRVIQDVPVRTIHSFKGEEADSVILINLNADFSSSLSKLAPLEKDIMRSLFYVGITRACRELTIITSHRFNAIPLENRGPHAGQRVLSAKLENCNIENRQSEKRLGGALQFRMVSLKKRQNKGWKALSSMHIAALQVTVKRDHMPFLPLALIPAGPPVKGRRSRYFSEARLGLKSSSHILMRVSRIGSVLPKVNARRQEPMEFHFAFKDLTQLHAFRFNDLAILRICARMIRAFFDNRINPEALVVSKMHFFSLCDFGRESLRANQLWKEADMIKRERQYRTRFQVYDTASIWNKTSSMSKHFRAFIELPKTLNRSVHKMVLATASLQESVAMVELAEGLSKNPEVILDRLNEIDPRLSPLFREYHLPFSVEG